MKRIALAALSATALSGCFVQYGPVTVIPIDGHRIGVMEVTSARNTWYAAESGASFRPGEAERYSRNVRAIEAHTGCRVDPFTMENKIGNTTAMVICQ